MLKRIAIIAPVLAGLLVYCTIAQAQCPGEWPTSSSQGFPGIDGIIDETIQWDPDGDGPHPTMLIACGVFTTAGDKTVSNVVGWDGSEWHDFGAPLINGRVNNLAVLNGNLIIGGEFSEVGGQTASSLVQYDGTEWRPLSLPFPTSRAYLFDMISLNGSLFVTGYFVGTPTTQRVAMVYDGQAWQVALNNQAGTRFWIHNNEVLLYRPLGSGPSLVHVFRNGAWVRLVTPTANPTVLGTFGSDLVASNSSGQQYSVINQRTGQAMGASFRGYLRTLREIDGRLYAIGSLTSVGTTPLHGIAVWNGTAWEEAAAPVGDPTDLAKLGDDLYAVGAFTAPRGPLLVLRDTQWKTPSLGLDGPVKALTTFNNALAVAGYFEYAGSEPAFGVAAWDGSSLAPIGPGFDSDALALVEHNGKLIAGGRFMNTRAATPRVAERLAQWDGTQWTQFDRGIGGEVRALATYQGRLYVGGSFATLGGDQIRSPAPCLNIARSYAPSQQGPLSQVGAGLNGPVRALHVHNDQLYAGGEFTLSGPNAVSRIARWDGSLWRTVSAGFDRPVFALTSYRGKLVAGGAFTSTFLRSANRVAILDDSGQWMPLGAGLNFTVVSLREYQGDLFAGGYFQSSGGVPVFNIARWNGQVWQPLGGVAGGGTDTEVSALAVFNNELILGGDFTQADGAISAYWARFTSAACCPGDLNDDGTVNDDDFVAFAAAYGEFVCPNRPCPADLNADGFIDDQDFVYFTQVYEVAECP